MFAQVILINKKLIRSQLVHLLLNDQFQISIMSTKIKNHQISCDSTLCFQRAMESDERSKIKWYFPISKQIKQSEIQRRKSNNWNEQNQKKINEKRYKQTKIICCRPQGG